MLTIADEVIDRFPGRVLSVDTGRGPLGWGNHVLTVRFVMLKLRAGNRFARMGDGTCGVPFHVIQLERESPVERIALVAAG